MYKGKKEKTKKTEIRKTNMALLVAVADTSAEETTPHLEHLRVMPYSGIVIWLQLKSKILKQKQKILCF